mgnify:CR=1 FL=1
MRKVKWAISEEAFKRHEFSLLSTALEQKEIDYFRSELDEKTREYEDIPYGTDECVVLHGPIKFIRTKNRGFIPGAFGFKQTMNLNHYMTIYPQEWFFNSDCVFLPWGLISSQKEKLRNLFGERVFIRPNSGYKNFTGFDLNLKDFEEESSARKQTETIFPEELCLISSSKEILGEYRIVICEKEPITGSQYRWDDILDVRLDVHTECWDFAKKVANYDEYDQLDVCYVLDVFLTHQGPLIGEFNSFASSGLYNCDRSIVVEKVSNLALKEWDTKN